MERLKKKHQTILQALNTINEAITLYEEPHPEKYHKALRDSLIQRFEYTLDLFWKFIKIYLQEHEKMDIAISSPRGIIREAAQARIIIPDEQITLLKAVEERNLTSHLYHEEIAEEIVQHVPQAYKTMNKIIQRLEL